ncbi:MAG: adenylate kinase [Lentisphaerae bacterium]|nr:adenylate kinase [Lentisphaerota bacterium]
MKAILLLGAPGAGKGTAAERIRDAAGYIHVSTGDMLREAVKQGTAIGREADGYMKSGALVPDEVMLRLVEARLQAGGPEDAYMFDGFPRTVRQADLLDQVLQRGGGGIEHVFFLDSPRDVLIQRLTGRRICRACGANFHQTNMPPKRAGVCDHCGGELYQRPDDCESTIISRLDVYNQKTESLIERYRLKGLLRRIDSSGGADKLAQDVLRVLQKS